MKNLFRSPYAMLIILLIIVEKKNFYKRDPYFDNELVTSIIPALRMQYKKIIN